MSKVLRTAATIVAIGALAVTTAGVGLGVAAGASVGTAFSFTAATIGISTSLLASTAIAGLSIVAGLTAKKPSTASTGNPEQFTADPNGFVPMVIGRMASAARITLKKAISDDSDEHHRSIERGPPVDRCSVLRSRWRGAPASA